MKLSIMSLSCTLLHHDSLLTTSRIHDSSIRLSLEDSLLCIHDWSLCWCRGYRIFCMIIHLFTATLSSCWCEIIITGSVIFLQLQHRVQFISEIREHGANILKDVASRSEIGKSLMKVCSSLSTLVSSESESGNYKTETNNCLNIIALQQNFIINLKQ